MLLIIVNLASVWCDDEVPIMRREASVGSFSYAATDFAKYDGSHSKTLTLVKKMEEKAFPRFDLAPLKRMGKTTVEFWPPDMDKEKFYSMRQESSVMQNWPELKVRMKAPLPETIPDILVDPKPQPEIINDFEALYRPTEGIVINEIAITNRSPVLFPTSEPTTKSPDMNVAFVARGNNKKRKLKKKVKSFVPFAETILPSTPAYEPVTEISVSNNGAQATPVYETIDEPYVNVFPPVRYTDVISNLSNLTEMSFGSNSSNRVIEIIDNPQFNDDYSAEIRFNVTDFASDIQMDNKEPISVNVSQITFPPRIFSSDLSPFDIMMRLLRQAIEERDIARIKNIAEMLEEPKQMEEVTVAMINVTEAATTATSSTSAPLDVTTYQSPEVVTYRSKIYLAPRVRNAQRKSKQLKAKTTEDKKSHDSSTTVTEMSTTMVPTKSTARLRSVKTTTEKMAMMSSVMPSDNVMSSSVATTVKSGRQGRSHITSRVRMVTRSSRKAARTIRRHTGKPV